MIIVFLLVFISIIYDAESVNLSVNEKLRYYYIVWSNMNEAYEYMLMPQKFGVGMIFKCFLLSYIIKTELSVLKTVVLLIYFIFCIFI